MVVDMTEELWAPIPSVPGYEASTKGRIRSVDRVIPMVDGRNRRWVGQLMQTSVNAGGYRNVGLLGKNRRVHLLVLEAFRGPRPEGLVACHNNDIKTDNRIENLRWDTRSANAKDALRHGRNSAWARTHCPRGHLLADPNLIEGAKPKRGCKACNRARGRCQKLKLRGVDFDQDAMSHDYYEQIMRGAA